MTRVVAVDTGSTDESADLVEAALRDGPLHGEVVRDAASTTFPQAVGAGLDRLHQSGTLPEWVWILHDDSTPAPSALAALLAAAQARPDADVLGPKLREWPSLRRLLELGVTITGTGRRETGLERGEYDQGQHDEEREVLAVNTAGMLVRREVLEALGGFDHRAADLRQRPRLRLAGGGGRTHHDGRAPGRGLPRRGRPPRGTTDRAHRPAHPPPGAPAPRSTRSWRTRRVAGSRCSWSASPAAPSCARSAWSWCARWDRPSTSCWRSDSVLTRPGDLRSARRFRRDHGQHPPRDDPERAARVRGLLAPFWLPYRHGLDAVSDVAAAVTNQASDVAERRRTAAAERDPSSMAARRVVVDEDDSLADTGVLARLFTSPIAVLLSLAVLVLLVASRAALGPVSGGALSPAPEAAADWWGLYLESWHPLGQGTDVPAPAYVLPMALLGALLTPTGAVSLLLLLAGPLALWGAWRFLRVVGRLSSPRGASRWLLLAGATSYAAVPLVSGAWGAGRLGTVVAAVLVPWLAHAALGFADPEADRRWRAGWRTALLLALLTAFAPVAWFLALLVGLVVVVAALALAPDVARQRSVWGPPGAALAAVPVLLAPWWVPLVAHGAGVALFLEIGRQPAEPALLDEGVSLLVGRVGELGALGAPWPLGLVPLALALLALLPRRSRVGVLVCWLVALVTGVLAVLLSTLPLRLGEVPAEPGLGVLLVVWQACLVVAAVLGGQGLLESGARPGVRRVAVAGVAGALVVALVGGLAWAVLSARERLDAETEDGVPAYMLQSAMTGDEHGVLVLRGTLEEGLTYTVLRDDGIRVGEDEVVALSAEDDALSAVVAALVSRPGPATVAALGEAGLEYVVMPAPADGRIASGLDATGGLLQASAEDRSTRAWQVDRPLAPDAVAGPGSGWRVALLVLQAGAVVVVLVLSAPTTRGGRR